MMPRVSVIIPIWNAERYLPECLESIRRQTLSDIEIICVDDGSDDSTGRILAYARSRDARIKVVSQENAGAGAARNAGMDVATGEYLSFCDPDDWCDVDMLETYYAKCAACDADLLMAPLHKFDSVTRESLGTMKFPRVIEQYQRENRIASPEELGDQLFTIGGNGPCNKLFRRSVAVENGLRFQHLRRTNDLYFVKMFLAKSRRLVFSDRACYHYRRGIMSATRRDDLSDSFCSALEAVCGRLTADGVFDRFAPTFGRMAIGSFMYNLRSIENPEFCDMWYARVRPRMLALFSSETDRSTMALSALERAVYQAVVESDSVASVLRQLPVRRPTPATTADAAAKAGTIGDIAAIRGRLVEAGKKRRSIIGKLTSKRKELAARRASVQKLEREYYELRNSLSYRVGLFVTWPLRKVYRAIKPDGRSK